MSSAAPPHSPGSPGDATPPTAASDEEQRARDAAELSRFGYAQQLLRDMGGFSSFALSFSIISILTGAVTLFGHGLKYGGPLVMSLGWPLVALFTLPIAASLAQLASSFPTAGALYHWSALLGGPGWGFATAWLNTLGQFAITAGIDYGLAEFVCQMLGLSTVGPGRLRVLALFAAILLSHGVLNHVGVRAVALLNRISAVYHIAGCVLLIGALAIWAPRQPLDFLLTSSTWGGTTEFPRPWPWGYGFLVGLLQAGFTFTGYDASAHVTEETVDPTRNAPWGIVLSVIVSGVIGWVMLLAVTLAIGDSAAVLAVDNPFIAVLQSALGVGGRALVWLVLGAMWFCGLSSVTSNSRILFAFARDGGLPGSARLASVSPRFRTPAVAVWVAVAAAFVVALWADAYSAMVALSTIALCASYAVPIAVGLRARRRGAWRHRGPWDLGRLSTVTNVLALGWTVVLTVLFVLPPNLLAGYTFVGAVALIAAAWLLWARRWFRGPRVQLAQEEATADAPSARACA